MSNDNPPLHGDLITRSASVPMVTDEKFATPLSKEIPSIEQIKPLDICDARIRRFSSGSMIMSLSSPKISRLSPARLEQIKYEDLDAFVMQEMAHERATCNNLAACSNLANMMTKEWSMCDGETSSDASSSTESSSVAAPSSFSSGIQTSGGTSPTVGKVSFPSPLSVLSPSPPPYTFASSVPNRIRADRCHKRSHSPKIAPPFTFSSSANASPASSTASGGPNSPTSLTPHHLLMRPSSLTRTSTTKRRYETHSLFYHHTTPSAAIGRSDPESPSPFRKSSLLVPAPSTSSMTIAPLAKETLISESEDCQPAKIKRPCSFVSDGCSSSMSESDSPNDTPSETPCSTPASSTPQSQVPLIAAEEGKVAALLIDAAEIASSSTPPMPIEAVVDAAGKA